MSDFQGSTENYERKVEVIEEYLHIDDSLVELEKNKDLVRMEMNIVEFPIFSRSKTLKVDQIKKYYFSSDKQSFLEVVPAVQTTIPGELEERIFIALLKIFRNNGYNQTFYCRMSDIFENMKIANTNTRNSLYAKIRNSISKLATTTFKFKNLFYSSELNKIDSDLIVTNILTYRVVTFKDSSNNEKNFFNDKRVKEVYKITLSQHFFENIVRKGYLTFDADELLDIKDSVTRSIYTMITKWRKNSLFLLKPAFYIARRVPLAWDGSAIRKTVLKIEKSLIELREANHILNYKMIRKNKWDKTDFEIYFDESHNKNKQSYFYEEKANFDKIITFVEHRQNEQNEDLNFVNIEYNKNYSEVFDVFPEIAKKLKSLPNTINEALKKYDYKYVKYTAEYTSLLCKTSFLKYFKQALENNWADEYIVKKEVKLEKQVKQAKKPLIEEAVIVDDNVKNEKTITWEDFEMLESYVREELEAAAYESFLVESNSIDSKIMKNIFKKSKKPLILKIMKEYKIPKEIKIIEEAIIEKELKVKSKMEEKIEKSSEIVGQYISIPQFMVKVMEITKSNGIILNFENLVPIFKLFSEYEDEHIKITYSEITKQGIINIK